MRSFLVIAAGFALGAPLSAAAAIADANWTETLSWAVNPAGGGHTGLAWAPDGSDRLFVLEKSGRVRLLSGALTTGAGTWSTFATEAVFTNNECGLIGMAFDPDFARNQYVYFFITVSDSEQQIVRYDASGATGTDRSVIVEDLPTDGENHDGGALGFGPDGKLYWAIGDLGIGAGVDADLASLAAKVGRANRDGTLPADNPFADGPGGNNDFIWARGFRNPFTMRFQPGTGQLWLNVVGTSWEQIFVVERGDHAGYNDFENNQPAGFITPKIVYRTGQSEPRNLTAASRSGNVATFTTSQPHLLRVGGNITIANAADPSFNGPNQYVASVLSATQFTVAQAGANLSVGAGGTAATLNQGSCLTGGDFYDATAASPAYRGNFFYGDCTSGRVMRAVIDPVSNEVRSVDYFATGYSAQVDVALGPDGALYFTGNTGTGTIRRAVFNATAQGLVVAGQHVRMDEGGRAVATVRLAMAPAGDVEVNVARSAGDIDVGVTGGATLTFTTANWMRPQAVAFDAAGDPDTTDDAATLTVSSAGLASVPIEVSVLDLGSVPGTGVFADGFED